ncbi:peptidylprolyl isomerase [Nannocystis sp.]|uniref:peptidylprolyl isomerase n=1 Tax=Nannocystis sp. TaxID=1962667 RepID=UPI0025F243EF|nr:peptidylprolyl isomerase [Nannocystis sp.]
MRPALALTTLSCLLACAPPQVPAAPPQVPAAPPGPAPTTTTIPATPLFELELRRDSAPLIARLGDPDPGPVILALARVGDPPAIAALLTLLRGDDPRRREHAARALGIAALLDTELTDLDAALLTAWPRADADERRAIAEALGRLGGPASLPVLRDALAPTASPALRSTAAIALGVLGRRKHPLDAPTRANLLALASDPALTYAALYALANEHTPPPDPSILALLRDHTRSSDRELQRLALAGLVRRSATPPLQACLTRELPAAASDPRRLAALIAPDRQTAVLAVLAWARSSIADRTQDEPQRLAHARQLHAALACLASETTAPSIRERHALEQLRTAIDRNTTTTTNNSPINPPATTNNNTPTSPPTATNNNSPTNPPTNAANLDDARREARRRLLARIDCLLAARLAHDPRWRPPLVCQSPLLRPGEREAHELGPLIHGFGGPWPARAARLDALLTATDPQLRLAAVAALGPLWHDPATTTIVHAWLLRALADPVLGVVGSAADVIAAPHDKPPTHAKPSLLAASDPLWQRLAALATAHAAREPELHSTLLATLAATGVAAGLPVCEASRAHASPAVRKAARACVQQLRGQGQGPAAAIATAPDPGPGNAASIATAAALPPPPLDPRSLPGAPIRWILSTEVGDLEIDLDPTAAPWAVAEIVALTRRGYYDGLRFHRDVPGFVLQGGDPDGNGWGGPGFVLPSEPGDHAFDRGAVGIADAGKDTGGSQFFFMHARAPHLEGRYTWIGRLRPDQHGHPDRLDALALGDHILRARIAPP